MCGELGHKKSDCKKNIKKYSKLKELSSTENKHKKKIAKEREQIRKEIEKQKPAMILSKPEKKLPKIDAWVSTEPIRRDFIEIDAPFETKLKVQQERRIDEKMELEQQK